MTEREILWTVIDPRGLRVSLAADTWAHIIQRRNVMLHHFEALQLTIIDPDEIYYDEWSTQQKAEGVWVEAYYKRRVLAGRFEAKTLLVSVKFAPTSEGAQGYVQTAVPTGRVLCRIAARCGALQARHTGRVQRRMKPIWKKST